MHMKNIIKITTFTLIFFSLLVLPFSLIHAQTDTYNGQPPAISNKLKNPLPNITSLEGFLKVILKAAIKIGIPLVVLAIIYSGFLFVTAMGNSEKLGKAKDAFIWSLIGAAVLLGAWAIAELILETVETINTETGMAPVETKYQMSHLL